MPGSSVSNDGSGPESTDQQSAGPPSPGPGQPAPARVLRAAAVGILVTVVLLVQGWLVMVITSPDPTATAHRDWIQFHRTAERVLAGAFDEIYPGSFVDDGRPDFDDGFYFLYPPPVAWLTVPFGLVTPWRAYVALVLVVATITLLATMICMRALGMRGSLVYSRSWARWPPHLGTRRSFSDISAPPWS